jgi:hypothetical protein
VNSECLYTAWEKHSGVVRTLSWETIGDLAGYDGDPWFLDTEDYSRLASMVRNYHGPIPLACVATEGMIDSFDAAWHRHYEDDEDVFDPDKEVRFRVFTFW